MHYQIPLGNINNSTLEAVLYQQAPACGLRAGFDKFQITHPVCQQCMGADTPQKSLLRQVGSIVYFKLYNPLMKRIKPGWGEV